MINQFEEIFVGVSHDCINDVCLADGTEIAYSEFDPSCSMEAPGTASTLKNSCMSIVTDLNGIKKKPNKDGKDRFRFWVTKDGVYPEGNIDSCLNGYDCTAYVIFNHKFFDWEKYLDNQKDVEPPEGCIDAKCSGCTDGYILNGSSCEAINIANCTSYSGANCSACVSGYTVSNGACVKNCNNGAINPPACNVDKDGWYMTVVKP